MNNIKKPKRDESKHDLNNRKKLDKVVRFVLWQADVLFKYLKF